MSNGNNAINTMSAAQVAAIMGQVQAQQYRISMAAGDASKTISSAFQAVSVKQEGEIQDLENTQMHTAKVMGVITILSSVVGALGMGMMCGSAAYDEESTLNGILRGVSKSGMLLTGVASALPDAVNAPYTAKIGKQTAEVAQTNTAATEEMNVLKEQGKIQKDALDTASGMGSSIGSLINNTMYAEMINNV